MNTSSKISSSTALVWFRRDLRLSDHRALNRALSENERVVPVFVFDDALLHHPLTGSGRVQFMLDSLTDLNERLRRRGAYLVTRHGVPHQELSRLAGETGATRLYYHEDTDRLYGRERDEALQTNLPGIKVIAVSDNGVFFDPKARQDWAAKWERRMAEPQMAAPDNLFQPPGIRTMGIPTLTELGLPPSEQRVLFEGGESWANRRLMLYLKGSVREYRGTIGYPQKCEDGGTSLLSAPLSFGNLSLRTAVQASLAGQSLQPDCTGRTFWHSRLYWHDHFTQKLRDWPQAQFQTINPVYDEIRQNLSDDFFQAWKNGRTGYPLVDAAMRALRDTGFLNFRMRAMVAAFWSYDLWQPWQSGAEWFQKCLTDFDTGINHMQWQMQAGNVGWHANRFYNPSQQAYTFDPLGLYIARHVPELAAVPMPFRVTPWLLSLDDQNKYGLRTGTNYPFPIVNHEEAARYARSEFKRLAPAAKAWLTTDEARIRTSSERWTPKPEKSVDAMPDESSKPQLARTRRAQAERAGQLTMELW